MHSAETEATGAALFFCVYSTWREVMSKKVTIQDIADALGISRNTVSKAINNSDGLADATREKILQKAVEMGYKQFSYVSALTEGLSQLSEPQPAAPKYQGEIALLTGRFLNHSHFASLMLDKFQMEVSQLGYTVNTHRVTEREIAGMTLPVTLQMDKVKAILCIEMFDWDYDNMLCELGLPIVFVDGPARIGGRTLPADQLYMDNETSVTQFVSDMLARGLNRIGFIGEYDHCQSFYERYSAFYLTMSMAGQMVDPKWIIHYNKLDELGEAIAALNELPEVFLCANDFVAWDTMQALASIGKRVPEDVLICGFDDSAESRFSKPPMTTVHIHTQIIAYSAVQLLVSRMQTPSLDYRTVHTETELIYRESTDWNFKRQ